MPNQTTNYKLNQWEPEDDFLRTDFNEDNAKIEEALTTLERGQCKFASGTYTGTGSSTGHEIEVEFQPSAVYICTHYGLTSENYYVYGGLILKNYPLTNNGEAIAGKITENGFKVYCNSTTKLYTDVTGEVYHYLAIKW